MVVPHDVDPAVSSGLVGKPKELGGNNLVQEHVILGNEMMTAMNPAGGYQCLEFMTLGEYGSFSFLTQGCKMTPSKRFRFLFWTDGLCVF